jgi:transcription antitermination factor NusG
MPWYPLYTRVNCERQAAKRIEDLGFDVLLPLEKRRPRLPGLRERVSALFPRYLFAKFHVNALPAILDVAQVVDVLRVNYVPAWVPEKAIESLQLAETMGLYDRTQPPRVGMWVEFGEGPFTGFVGRVTRAHATDRVKILVEFLGGLVEADASVYALREA